MFSEGVKYVSFAVVLTCGNLTKWLHFTSPIPQTMSLLDHVRFVHREHLERKAQDDSLHL